MKCAERKPGNYPGEWWFRKQGKARGFENGDFVCDLCNATILKGEDCVAQSYGVDQHPYQPWEEEYLGDAPGKVDGTIRVYNSDGTVEEIPPK
jgi:hypothetical protein